MPRQSRFGRAAELPPRTRRIPLTSPPKMNSQGTTSAYAENTEIRNHYHIERRNYLRVRGEYTNSANSVNYQGGTTSAYAENTRLHKDTIRDLRNYLRVRGEYRGTTRITHRNGELPPRTRRIPKHLGFSQYRLGTTSAYAENTCSTYLGRSSDTNYLRVRGEYLPPATVKPRSTELPPRTRRIPNRVFSSSNAKGTTSAYAENTLIQC